MHKEARMDVKMVLTLVAWMLLCISNRGSAECSLSDLVVTQATAAAQTEHQYPLYLVTVQNNCICTQTNVKLACAGFNSGIPIKPAGIITSDGDDDLCILSGGSLVTNDYPIKFAYSWSTKFSFAPVSSNISCSVL